MVERRSGRVWVWIWVKDEPDEAEEVGVVEEPVVSGGEEEWPSINAIPGLEASEPKSRPEQAPAPSQSRPAADDSSESSSLGELRFQDE